MNTRVQVSCVTEMATGIDIVKEGIRAAAGEQLSYAQRDVVLRDHAISAASTPGRAGTRPSAGQHRPLPGDVGPGVQVDSVARRG
jgi:acetyl-CoA/propionyl-CoA carboxylase biotin carboxyl carrier protein